jgi:hypothetical protein
MRFDNPSIPYEDDGSLLSQSALLPYRSTKTNCLARQRYFRTIAQANSRSSLSFLFACLRSICLHTTWCARWQSVAA